MDKNIPIDQNMIDYIFSHSESLHKVQKKILKFNDNLGKAKRLQISILQANFLQFLIKAHKFKSCLEVGTFTGYSSLSMALSLPKNGKVYAIDKDIKTNKIALNFFKEAKVNNKIFIETNNGINALKKLVKSKKKFDLILIDADKESYIKYFNYAVQLISKRGIILIDNTLWKGEVLNQNANDKLTLKIKKFNEYIKKKRINKYILPLGDGFTICWK
jgi:predicted O-methyltransferase YrrM|tara:strand:- start:2072 stop:2722 length:651 start_codon:yes stop_codon:yes gene_type:complete